MAINTEVEKVEEVLLKAWNLPKPQFIITILGGTKYFKMSDRIETNFINGIIELIKQSSMLLYSRLFVK